MQGGKELVYFLKQKDHRLTASGIEPMLKRHREKEKIIPTSL